MINATDFSTMNASHFSADSPDIGLNAFCATGICCGLDMSDAAQLLAMAQPISFVAGSRMVRHGEPSRGAYVIRKGRIEARLTLPGGGEKTVVELADGSMFGEMSLLDNGQSIASVFAVTDVDGWFIERNLFRALIAGRNPAALAIQRTITSGLVARLGMMNGELQRQTAPEDRRVLVSAPRGDPLANTPRTISSSFDYQRFLSLLSFFSGFTGDEIASVVASAKILEVSRGQWLFSAGQPANACYLVVRGAVEANVYIENCVRRLAVLGPGSLVGYMGILADSPHNANTLAREDSVLLEFSAVAFMALYKGTSGAEVKTQHAIQCNLLQSLSRSYSQLSRLVTQARLSEALQARAVRAGI
ncbi:MAG: cyclic nucleotide-binding domain-containing protein [Burkholderiales bacterium]|nr:cyclic nucleotide-binding domain-containing protein [Burkholderiales bacterium]